MDHKHPPEGKIAYVLETSFSRFFYPHVMQVRQRLRNMSYNFYGEMTIEEARRLIVSFASDLQNRTHLFNFAKDFEGEKDGKQSLWLKIYFLDNRHNYVLNENCICMVSLYHGNLEYHVCGKDGERRFIPIYEESFEEAAEMVSKSFLQNCNAYRSDVLQNTLP